MSHFNEDGIHPMKKLTCSVANCMFNRNYILFPILSGTNDLGVEIGIFHAAFYPCATIMTSLLAINDINEIIRELSAMETYEFVKPLLKDRNFIWLVQSIGGHPRALEYLIEIISKMDLRRGLDLKYVTSELETRVKWGYKFNWDLCPNDLIEAYILRTRFTQVASLQLSQTVPIHELEACGMISLSPDFERDDRFLIDFPYVWLKMLVRLSDDDTLTTLFGNVFSILENDMCGKAFEKLNHSLLTIKIYCYILKGKKTFTLKEIFRGAQFVDPTFDLVFDTPSTIKESEFECHSSVIATEYDKVDKHDGERIHFEFVYVGKSVRVDLYPLYKNCVIISDKELTKYYGMAFAPRLSVNDKMDIK